MRRGSKGAKLFVALYPGRCGADGCRIDAGQEIGYAEGYDRPLCKTCWHDVHNEAIAQHTPACPSCFLIHVGECL